MQESPVSKEFWDDFKRFFLRGVAALLPTLLTVMIIVYGFNFVQNRIGKHINRGVIYLVCLARGLKGDEEIADFHESWSNHYLDGVGFILAIIGIYFVGRFVASFFGRFVWRLIERALYRTPVVKQIYPNVKQVTDFLLRERSVEFSRVVAVEYPRKGVYSLGLVTGPAMRAIQAAAEPELLTVFIPSSPTPVTGYTITIRRDEVIDLHVTIDEALRFTVSGGVLMPPSQQLEGRAGEAQIRRALTGGAPAEGEPEGNQEPAEQ